VRFALVGCGRISANHIEALRQHRARAQLVAVCDNQSAALAAAVAKTGVKGYASLDALLDTASGEDAPDIVTLATPSGLHPRQAMRVAAAGRHVLTEKPMATKWDEGLQMVRACREAGVKLFVVKQNRLNPTMQLLKQAIDAGRFGRIFMCTVNVFWTRPQSYYDDAPWRGRWDLDGGAFLNQASHYVDMVDWLVGPVDNVHAYTATLARDIEAEDTGVMSLRLRKGGLGGQHHHPRRTWHGAHRRRGGEPDPALGVRRGAAGRCGREGRQLRHAFGLRPRPPAVLRQRHRHAARRTERGSGRLQRPAFAGSGAGRLPQRARRRTCRPAAGVLR